MKILLSPLEQKGETFELGLRDDLLRTLSQLNPARMVKDDSMIKQQLLQVLLENE